MQTCPSLTQVEELTTKLGDEEAEMTVRKAEVEKELVDVQPILEQAKKVCIGLGLTRNP